MRNTVRHLPESIGITYNIDLYSSFPVGWGIRNMRKEIYGDARLVQMGNIVYQVPEWLYELAQ